MKENKVVVFNHIKFVKIITLIFDNGEPWFYVKDIGEALKIQDIDEFILNEIDKEDIILLTRDEISNYFSTAIVSLENNNDVMRFINKIGLCYLISKNKNPDIKEFKQWINMEILPSVYYKNNSGNSSEESQINLETLLEISKYNTIIAINDGDYPRLYKQAIISYLINDIAGECVLPVSEM